METAQSIAAADSGMGLRLGRQSGHEDGYFRMTSRILANVSSTMVAGALSSGAWLHWGQTSNQV